MKEVFADTCYWLALINRNDELHDRAYVFSTKLNKTLIVTTEEVLTEVLAFYRKPHYARLRAIGLVNNILVNKGVEVCGQTHEGFSAGYEIYRTMMDKGFSLTDCISIATMRNRGLTHVLTNDVKFRRVGFETLS